MNTSELMELVQNESIEYFIPLKDIPTELERKQYEETYQSYTITFPTAMKVFRLLIPI